MTPDAPARGSAAEILQAHAAQLRRQAARLTAHAAQLQHQARRRTDAADRIDAAAAGREGGTE